MKGKLYHTNRIKMTKIVIISGLILLSGCLNLGKTNAPFDNFLILDSTIYSSILGNNQTSQMIHLSKTGEVSKIKLPGFSYREMIQKDDEIWVAGTEGFLQYNLKTSELNHISEYSLECKENAYPETNTLRVIGKTPTVWHNLGMEESGASIYGLSRKDQCLLFNGLSGGSGAVANDEEYGYAYLLFDYSFYDKMFPESIKIVKYDSEDFIAESEVKLPVKPNGIFDVITDGEYHYLLISFYEEYNGEPVDDGNSESAIIKLNNDGELIDFQVVMLQEIFFIGSQMYIDNDRLIILDSKIQEYHLDTLQLINTYEWEPSEGGYLAIGKESIYTCPSICKSYDKHTFEFIEEIPLNSIRFKESSTDILLIEGK